MLVYVPKDNFLHKNERFIYHMTKGKMTSTLRNIALVLLVLAIAAGAYFWKPIQAIYFSGVPNDIANRYVCIPTGSNFEEVVQILKSGRFIKDEAGFRWLAGQMNYKKDKMRAGRFEIQPGWTNRELIQQLRNGEQAPVKVIFNNERLLEDVAGKAARFIEPDSLTILQVLRDPAFLSEIGYTPESLMSIFIPNTYEMYWNTDPKAFVKKMQKEHDAFWAKNDRKSKAKALNLSPEEVYTVASIVERETNYVPEKPTVAGVYLNRLKINMKLQADPTCVFASRDFATHRVTEYHLMFESPYNTYLHTGLPPGPISMASIPSLDAVLNYEKHNYLYFCAKPDDSGTHAFAATLAGHNVNVGKFRAWMRTRGY